MRILFIKDFFVREDDAEIKVSFGNEATLIDESTNEVMFDSGYVSIINPNSYLILCDESEVTV